VTLLGETGQERDLPQRDIPVEEELLSEGDPSIQQPAMGVTPVEALNARPKRDWDSSVTCARSLIRTDVER